MKTTRVTQTMSETTDYTTITVQCPHCGEEHEVEVEATAFTEISDINGGGY